MLKNNKDVDVGYIEEIYPGNIYKIKTLDGRIIKGYLAGRLRRARISVLIGDKVKYDVDEYGAHNRITRRL